MEEWRERDENDEIQKWEMGKESNCFVSDYITLKAGHQVVPRTYGGRSSATEKRSERHFGSRMVS